MNSSALSDDGKFSTRALRNVGNSELEFNAPEPGNRNIRQLDDRGDGMGLSTHVETSDKGSRRGTFNYRNEERIDEVEEEGSGRTSPPGTIGEVHEYMSENIESNIVHKIKNLKGQGNKSVVGAKDPPIDRQPVFEERSEVTACSNFAVIREKIPLTNDSKHVKAFKHTYDTLFAEF